MARRKMSDEKVFGNLVEKVIIYDKFTKEHPGSTQRTLEIVCGAMEYDRVTPRKFARILQTIGKK